MTNTSIRERTNRTRRDTGADRERVKASTITKHQRKAGRLEARRSQLHEQEKGHALSRACNVSFPVIFPPVPHTPFPRISHHGPQSDSDWAQGRVSREEEPVHENTQYIIIGAWGLGWVVTIHEAVKCLFAKPTHNTNTRSCFVKVRYACFFSLPFQSNRLLVGKDCCFLILQQRKGLHRLSQRLLIPPVRRER